MTETLRRSTMVNAFDPDRAADLPPVERQMIEDRQQVLAPAYRLFYAEPVHLVRGSGTRVWDHDGNEYLDAYNNVVSVGHGRPEVVAAVSTQMSRLCTHTRYLHEGILTYTRRLLDTLQASMPQAQAIFTCTGSEANDLAVRIARHHTSHEGVIVTSEAYHGNSFLTAGFSPSLGDRSPLGPWVRRVPAPDSYRIPLERMRDLMVDSVRTQIDDLRRRGVGLAAFVVDSIFSSDGIFAEPRNFLEPVRALVHEAGGLFIADEVQSGFGRTGPAIWGHIRHSVRPDIVTMGKPMGNGYPVAGIAVRPEVVAQFGADQRYFNTFGGNTVAIAAAQATLEVLLTEQLPDKAEKVGELVRRGLVDLSERHPVLGDVRGAGLYLGVECVDVDDPTQPNAAAATAIVNDLRRRRVLISATGPRSNVLKIRPPLVFSERDADRLLSAFAQTLRESF